MGQRWHKVVLDFARRLTPVSTRSDAGNSSNFSFSSAEHAWSLSNKRQKLGCMSLARIGVDSIA